MKLEEVVKIVGTVPWMNPAQGKILYDFILKNGIFDCLELGFFHGTSSCYIGAALHEQGKGHLKTIDLIKVRNRTPNIYELLKKTGLEEFVEPVFADTSHTWELMKIIEQQSLDGICRPLYDFCYIDGPHTWDTDGFGFFLVAKLLKPGGWILFDDLEWTFSASAAFWETEYFKRLPEDQRITPQIGKVFNLLVRQHPEFEKFSVTGHWGWARKKKDIPESEKGLGFLTWLTKKLHAHGAEEVR